MPEELQPPALGPLDRAAAAPAIFAARGESGQFVSGFRLGATSAISRWATGFRLLGLGEGIDEDRFKEIVGARKMRFRPGLSAAEVESLARVYDEETVHAALRSDGWPDTLAAFAGQLLGGFIDPLAVATIPLGAGINTLRNLPLLARYSKYMFRVNSLKSGATAGFLESGALLPADIYITNQQGQRDFTAMDAALLLGAGTAISGVVGMWIGRRARLKGTRDPAGDLDPGTAHSVAQESVDQHVPPDDALEAVNRASQLADEGKIDPNARPVIEETTLADELVTAQEETGARIGGLEVSEPNLDPQIEQFKFRGVPVQFANPIENALAWVAFGTRKQAEAASLAIERVLFHNKLISKFLDPEVEKAIEIASRRVRRLVEREFDGVIPPDTPVSIFEQRLRDFKLRKTKHKEATARLNGKDIVFDDDFTKAVYFARSNEKGPLKDAFARLVAKEAGISRRQATELGDALEATLRSEALLSPSDSIRTDVTDVRPLIRKDTSPPVRMALETRGAEALESALNDAKLINSSPELEAVRATDRVPVELDAPPSRAPIDSDKVDIIEQYRETGLLDDEQVTKLRDDMDSLNARTDEIEAQFRECMGG